MQPVPPTNAQSNEQDEYGGLTLMPMVSCTPTPMIDVALPRP
jgi:hypothetical protein